MCWTWAFASKGVGEILTSPQFVFLWTPGVNPQDVQLWRSLTGVAIILTASLPKVLWLVSSAEKMHKFADWRCWQLRSVCHHSPKSYAVATWFIYLDNKGAEAAARRGNAKSWDHCQIIHEVWTMALRIAAHLWIERVSWEDNLSDLPSREEYGLLREGFNAKWRSPVSGQMFLDM